MNIGKKEVTIRWKMQAPEIDEYDVISMKNILSKNIEVWEVVEYKL